MKGLNRQRGTKQRDTVGKTLPQLWRQTLGKAGKRRVFGVGAENNDSIPLHALPDRHAVFIDETLPSALVGALRCLGEALDNMTHPVPDSRRELRGCLLDVDQIGRANV